MSDDVSSAPLRFFEEVRRAFSFLVRDLNFKETQEWIVVPECGLLFESAATCVAIKYEMLIGPWVELGRRQSGGMPERYDLTFLLEERAPHWRTSDTPTALDDSRLPELLDELARQLEQWGGDILRGDFAVLPRLKERAMLNLRRKNIELFGVEDP